MKNYYNTFILLLLFIVLIFIFVVTNLNKFDNFSNYYVEGCKKNTYGNNGDRRCEVCKSCTGVIDTQGQQCNLTNNLCYRSGCNSSNPGVCEKLKDCSLLQATPVNKYKYRVNGRNALDGDNGQQGTCSLISCPSNKYIDLDLITQSDKNGLESGNLPLNYIQNQLCREPPSCGEGLSRSGFIRAENGELGSKGSCVDSWKLCTSTTEYWDEETKTCMPQSGNTSCPANEYISTQGAPKTNDNPGRKIECSSCYKSCDDEDVTYYSYNFDAGTWTTSLRRCNSTNKCYREACTNGDLGDCKHATYYQYSQDDARPLNNTAKATDSSYGYHGNFENHPPCSGNMYRTRTEWNKHNDRVSNCSPFAGPCTGANQYLSGAVAAPGGADPSTAFGSEGSCQVCSGGQVIGGICTTCDYRTQYLQGGCQNCPSTVANGTIELTTTSKTDISECPVNCSLGYKPTVSSGSATTCNKCPTDEYMKGAAYPLHANCQSCNALLKNAIEDNDPDVAKYLQNQCKFKCNTGYELSGSTCNPCGNNEYYTAGDMTADYGLKSGFCNNCDTVTGGSHNNDSVLNMSKEDCTIRCDAGHKFSETGSGNDNVKTCTACPAGSYLATAGIETQCTQCEKGEYQDLTGQNNCKSVCTATDLENKTCLNYTDTLGANEIKTCTGYGNHAITNIADFIANNYTNGDGNGGKAEGCFTDLGF